jgi:MYXO-CTERM domain-containing protein
MCKPCRRYSPLMALTMALTMAMTMATPAHATWSIVAVDPDTGEVGATGATCAPLVWEIAELVPDEGAVVALAYTSVAGRNEAADLLAEGADAEAALEAVTDPADDADLELRQYGIASMRGPAAAFTGGSCDAWAGSLSEETFSVQGNVLVGGEVVVVAHQAFLATEGEPLADRLLQALEAGAAEGGDSRCDADVAARSAFLFVARPDDDRYTIDLTASDSAGAVAALREKYDSGTTQNCHCDHSSAGRDRSPGPAGLALLALLMLRRRRGQRRGQI